MSLDRLQGPLRGILRDPNAPARGTHLRVSYFPDGGVARMRVSYSAPLCSYSSSGPHFVLGRPRIAAFFL